MKCSQHVIGTYACFVVGCPYYAIFRIRPGTVFGLLLFEEKLFVMQGNLVKNTNKDSSINGTLLGTLFKMIEICSFNREASRLIPRCSDALIQNYFTNLQKACLWKPIMISMREDLDSVVM